MLYRITTVHNGNAVAERIGEEPMPDISWLDVGEAQAVFASDDITQTSGKANADKKLIAMYVTHSDESYVPSDGSQSINGRAAYTM